MAGGRFKPAGASLPKALVAIYVCPYLKFPGLLRANKLIY